MSDTEYENILRKRDQNLQDNENKRENEEEQKNISERIPVVLPQGSSYYTRKDVEFFGKKPLRAFSTSDSEEQRLERAEAKRIREQRAKARKNVEVKPVYTPPKDAKSYDDHVDYADNIKLPKHVEIVTREMWGAVEPLSEDPVVGPPLSKVILFYTGMEACYTKEECCQNMRKLQELYMVERKLADIPWNFLIGCDGRVYEGRGWGLHPKKVNSLYKFRVHEFKSYDIAYMGPYFKSRKGFNDKDMRSLWPKLSFTRPMYNAVEILVRTGVKSNFIDDGFGLISQVGC